MTLAIVAGQPAGPLQTRLNAKDGLTYLRLPGGSFLYGCSPGDADCFHWEPAPVECK